MLWLDHLIFGNGYTWIGGFGAQLESRQWFHPKPGERRKLCGREFHPFISTRKWLRVSVSWATALPNDIDAANAELRQLYSELGTQ